VSDAADHGLLAESQRPRTQCHCRQRSYLEQSIVMRHFGRRVVAPQVSKQRESLPASTSAHEHAEASAFEHLCTRPHFFTRGVDSGCKNTCPRCE
jgi:hypothetical protein